MIESTCHDAATWWVSQGIHVVPVKPVLRDGGKGKLAPHPYDLWEWNDRSKPRPAGRLVTSEDVNSFWSAHPEAQLSIVIDGGLTVIDIDLKNLNAGAAPDGFPFPQPFPGGRAEESKSGGSHIFFRHRIALPEGTPSRWIGFAGYVDVLAGGLLFTAPSVFTKPDGSSGGACRVTTDGSIPEFDSIFLALTQSAPWLAQMWKDRLHRASAPARRREDGVPFDPEGLPPPDPAILENAEYAIVCDPELDRVYDGQIRKPNGEIDRSLTEWTLVKGLKSRGFPFEVVWAIVLGCPYTKSPHDRRGIRYFIDQVWGRQESPVVPPMPRPEAGPQTPAAPGVVPQPPGALRPLWDPDSRVPGKMNPNRSAFVDTIMVREHFASYLDTEELLRFDGGYYNGFARQFVKKWVEEEFRQKDQSAQDKFRTEVIHSVIARSYVPREDFNPDGWLCVPNGLINTEIRGKHTFLDHHDPSIKLNFRLGAQYEPSATCPKFVAFIERVLPDPDGRQAVQEMFGCCLRPGNPYKRAFFFVGKPDSGKSTLLEVLRGVLGKANTSTIALQSLAENRFSSSLLWGRLANIYADLSPRLIRDGGLFKMLTGGADEVPAEKKFQTPFSFVNPAKLIFSANELPAFPNADDAFFLRWEVVEFSSPIPKEKRIRDYDKILLQEEGPGILNWALEGLERLEVRGDFASGGSPEVTRKKWQRLSNSLAWFVAEMLEEDKEGRIPKTELWDAYSDFCEVHGVPRRELGDITRELPQILSHVHLGKTTIGGRGSGKQPVVWFGVRYRIMLPSMADGTQKALDEARYSGYSIPTGDDVPAGAGARARENSVLEREEDGVPGVQEQGAGPDPGDIHRGQKTRAQRAMERAPPHDAPEVPFSAPLAPLDEPPASPGSRPDEARVAAAYDSALGILRSTSAGSYVDQVLQQLGEAGFTGPEANAAIGRVTGGGMTRMQGDLIFLKLTPVIGEEADEGVPGPGDPRYDRPMGRRHYQCDGCVTSPPKCHDCTSCAACLGVEKNREEARARREREDAPGASGSAPTE